MYILQCFDLDGEVNKNKFKVQNFTIELYKTIINGNKKWMIEY